MLALVLALMRMSNICPFRFLDKPGCGKVAKAISKFNPVSLVANVYVEVFRATPLLVLIHICRCLN